MKRVKGISEEGIRRIANVLKQAQVSEEEPYSFVANHSGRYVEGLGYSNIVYAMDPNLTIVAELEFLCTEGKVNVEDIRIMDDYKDDSRLLEGLVDYSVNRLNIPEGELTEQITL